MNKEVILNVDNEIIEFANQLAKENGISINKLFENFVLMSIANKNNNLLFDNKEIKKTNWNELVNNLSSINVGLPKEFKFDRDIANER